ncbi:hypothetical protein A1D25_10535 [Ursidibacter arcticus]|uniref:DUF4870 family protein n=1 Tax=Ursidibacter arcticus TaxID=1524965 RepID=UPI0012FCF953|nr:hypothetical protein [Ursidibacter arcticus]KAE9536916.1 hypothetical protein A1D25_10535 [Ursidibacter arcticus]
MSDQQLTDIKDPHRTLVIITYALFLSGLLIGGLPTIIGLIIVYVKRKDLEGTVYFDHFRFLIRTFWLSLLGAVIGALLSFIGIGFIVIVVVGLWYAVRIIYGFIKVLDKKPVNPTSWLL